MDMVVLFSSLIILIIVGVPIGYSIGFATLLTLATCSNVPLVLITQKAFTGVDSFPLMAIPFFILAGVLMTHGGIAKRLLDFVNVFVSGVTGSLGIVSTVSCMFFSAISGSALATTSAIGSFMLPAMREKGYDMGSACSIVASAGAVGVILPPSIPFVIYGVVTGTSIGDLFIAGIIPGVLMTISLVIAFYIVAKKRGYKGEWEPVGVKIAAGKFIKAIWALIGPVIVLGGIYGGIFTPTEAAVIAVIYSLLVGVFVYRELNLKKIYDALVETMMINGIIVFIVGLSVGFAVYLSLSQIPTKICSILLGITDNKILLLLIINIFLLLIGTIVDNIPATIILSPILLPAVVDLGMSPVQFGVILTFNLAMGFVTPPYGQNLFVAASVAKIPVDKTYLKALPFILALFIVLLIITYLEGPTMFLVNLIK